MLAADLFCDADTRRHAVRCIPLKYAEGGFDAAEFRRHILPLLADAQGFLFGSGFEAQPALLEEIAQHVPLLGNPPATVARCKNPQAFFGLLANLAIPYPETVFAAPEQTSGWLSKMPGGSGGLHIRRGVVDASPHYYQREAGGVPHSLLFVADGAALQAVGFNRLLLSPLPEHPYRYGGVASQARLPDEVGRVVLAAACGLTRALGLRGLNSLDFLVDGDRFQVLEINPRLSASFALYDAEAKGSSLLRAHLDACRGRLHLHLPQEPAQAHLIYYASTTSTVPVEFRWPEWAADLPGGGSVIVAGAPLCTVTAAASTMDSALALAHARQAWLDQQIQLSWNPDS